MAQTVNDIEELDDVQHTRLRPSVNLGEDVYVTSAREVVDNAVEESARPTSSGTGVSITLHADTSFTVTDDGRGLPIDSDANDKNGIVKTLGTARAGGKFKAHDDAENTGAGLNGIGAAAAVFISRRVDVTVRTGGKEYVQSFKDGYPGTFSGSGFDPDSPFTRNDKLKLRGSRTTEPNGTSVRMLLDPTIKPDSVLDMSEVLLRAQASARMSGVKLAVHDEGWGTAIPPELLQPFDGTGGVDTLLPMMCAATSNAAPITTAVMEGRSTYSTGRGETAFTWKVAAGPATEGKGSAHGFCNTVRTPYGGTHLNAAMRGMSEALADKAGRLRGLSLTKGESGPEAQDFAEVTALVIDLRAPDVAWDGQAKTKVTSRSLSAPIEQDVRRSVTVWAANPSNANTLLAWAKLALEAARTRRSVDSARTRARAASKARGLGVNLSLPEKLLPSRETGRGSSAELLICEGDSAKATIKAARDATTQAVFPVRGKTLNSWNKSVTDARKNAEFSGIEAILGCGIGNSVNTEECRFDRIIFASDADPDGMAINSQLIATFVRFYRPLIKEGMVFIAVPPLFVVTWQEIRFYCVTVEDKNAMLTRLRTALGRDETASSAAVRAARDGLLRDVSDESREKLTTLLAKKDTGSKIKVDRCKGLGEMSADDFHATVLNPETRTLIRLSIPDDQEVDLLCDDLFGPSGKYAERRREWMASGYPDSPELEAESEL